MTERRSQVASRAGSEPVASEGLSIAQEPKYTVNGSAIVNRASGEAIPADEPVFILRARDRNAISLIASYSAMVVHGEYSHWDAVQNRIADFVRFRDKHPERMKAPDTAPIAPAAAAEPSEKLQPCPTCGLAGQAIADERDAYATSQPQWKALAESLMGMVSQISEALGIDDESQETANGAGEILDRIAELKAPDRERAASLVASEGKTL